jgi:large subunit ribosomal protein L25
MSDAETLVAYPRETTGHANRRLAAEGHVPAVLYGSGREAMSLSLLRHDLDLFFTHHAGATLVSLAIDGEKKPVNAVLKEVQRNPVKGTIVHVDFQAVRMDVAIHTSVPIHTVNDPVGVKAGGILTVNLHEVNIEAKPGDIPEAIDVNVEALEVGDSLHISDVVAPAGVKLLDDPETIVASVQAPRAEVEEAELEEAPEPEVIGASESEE